ncbi:hypothetical protein CR152_31460 [Massilia violaceinigra]|uniref:Uncharacterized protein n=1 Tax=Massilia violaceinigra TaxID=2045208 RepID=A0A2D2DU78_9BURK|nr:hypothetical protein [Massilia violaceinigra]ATQ78531.1 hypothetical protein CR152_31460 [Massilia violaceinigra]
MSMNAVPSGPPEPDHNGAPVAGGGGPPYDGDMDRRLTVLETRFDTILPTLATKADLAGLRLDLNEKMDKLRLDLNEKMDRLRSDLDAALMSTVKWCAGIALTLFAGMACQGLYLGTQINNLAARLPPASPVAPGPDRPAASPTRALPQAPAQPGSAAEPG